MLVKNITSNSIWSKNGQSPRLAKNKTAKSPPIRPSYGRIPAMAFCGAITVNLRPKCRLTEALKNINGEVYITEIQNKITGKSTRGYIAHDNSSVNGYINTGETSLKIFGEEGIEEGIVGLNPYGWQNAYDCPKSGVLSRPYLRLHELENYGRNTYSGIGSSLIQAAIEKSLKSDAKGRIYVYASNNSDKVNDPFGFYNKMKLSIVPPNKDFNESAIIKYINTAVGRLKGDIGPKFDGLSPDEVMLNIYKAIAKENKVGVNEIPLGFREYMYLHDDAVQNHWRQIIEKRPILDENNRIK